VSQVESGKNARGSKVMIYNYATKTTHFDDGSYLTDFQRIEEWFRVVAIYDLLGLIHS